MIRQSLIGYGRALVRTTASMPQPAGSELLLRVHGCGVCHSDLHLQDGHFDLGEGKRLDIRSGRKLPFTMGHEISGYVEAAGPDVAGLNMRTLYVVYAWIGCGESRAAVPATDRPDRRRASVTFAWSASMSLAAMQAMFSCRILATSSMRAASTRRSLEATCARA